MNKKGVTLVSVVVIIIVIIIIATTSIVAGNRLILNTRTYADNQKIETIRQALTRRKTEVNMEGSIVPKGESYPGTLDPLIGDGTYRAIGWYSLDEPDLLNLGVKDIDGRYLVNYQYYDVFDMSNSEYLEKFFACEFTHKVFEEANNSISGNELYIGEKLSSKKYAASSGDINMYEDKNGDESVFYGDGWYKVTSAQIINKIQEYFAGVDLNKIIKNDYLVNYEDGKYVKMQGIFVHVVE